MEKLITLEELFESGAVSKRLERALEDGLRSGLYRGYKCGRKWVVNPQEILEDIKTKGQKTGEDYGRHTRPRNKRETQKKAVESRLLRDRDQERTAIQAPEGEVFHFKTRG